MRRNREGRARIKMIQEAHLDKQGQRVIDAIHHDIGTSYADLYDMYHAGKAFGYALDTIIRGIEAIWRKAARILGGNWSSGARAGTLHVDSMRAAPDGIYIEVTAFPEIPPMEVNVQIIEEATP